MNDSDKYFMMTDRLGFRRWREDDLPLALGVWGDYEVTKLIDARGQLTTNQVQERLIKEIATAKEHGVQYWPIFLHETAEHIGCCGLRPYDLSKSIYEIGFRYTHDEYYPPTGLKHPSYLLKAEEHANL